MKISRTWRTATAGIAASAMLLTIGAGAATAQVPDLPGFDALEDVLDPDQLGELADLLGGDGFDGLSPDAITDLLEGTPLEGLIDTILDAIGGGLPGDDDGDDADDDANGDDDQVAEGDAGPIPDTGMGGFAGYAQASGLTVFVGLPSALADGLDPVLDALGVAGTLEVDGQTLSGIRIDLAQVQADLERAAQGEEISSESRAFITNLLLASGAADEPGNCTGAPQSVTLPPDAETPLLELVIAGVNCEETDERALAEVEILGLDIRLGALLELGLPGEVADGLQQVIDALNESLLTPLSEGLCTLTDALGLPCEDNDTPLLQVGNPLDIDVPVVDLDVVGATAEVTQDGDSITATATSTLAGLNVLGLACAGNAEGSGPAVFSSTATSDGETATRSGEAPPLRVGNCTGDQNLLTILLEGGPLADIGVLDAILQDDLVDGALEPLFDGLDTLLDALTTSALTQGSVALGPVEGAGTSAATNRYTVAQSLPLAGLPGLGDVLGEVAVIVTGGETEVGVNAVPAGEEPPAPPEDPADPTPAGGDPTPTSLPRTGAGAGLMLGLAALGAAGALRRRES